MKKYVIGSISIIAIFIFAILNILQESDHSTTNKEVISDTVQSPSPEQQVENLEAFTRVYGYVRYFHPSDEAEQIDWMKFAMHGTEYVLQAKDTNELKEKLEELFLPIAPTIQVYQEGEVVRNSFEYVDTKESSLKYVAWQHLGKATSLYNGYLYKKEKIIFNDTSSTEKLFESLPSPGDAISESIKSSLKVKIPLVLYTDGEKTLGTTEQTSQKLDELVAYMKEIKSDHDTTELRTRLAGMTILWNDIQHFYPYFEEINVDWLQELSSFTRKALDTKNKEEYSALINFMTEKLDDGHISYNNRNWVHNYRLPFTVDIADKHLVITSSLDDLPYEVGDVIVSINGKSADEYLLESQQEFSGSPQTKELISLQALEYGKKDETLLLEIQRNGENHSFEVPYGFPKKRLSNFPVIEEKVIEMEEGIYYVNTLKVSYDDLIPHLDNLAKAKGVIFEFRGYPERDVSPLLSHLTSQTVQSPHFFREQLLYPDHKKLAGYNEEGRWIIEPNTPKFNGKVVFLTNANAISAPETILGVVEDNQLGYIVGQPTAGSNGSINDIILPGNLKVMFTGMKVVKGDGSPHHLIGIQPTHEVERTIEGVKKRKDEYIEKAIEVIND
ncbi:S41 family peptidase [Sutcliffiella horikoshii]|uniref:S41 family peptidase n=1 Tax=Sutcliffiella horikoshii TaxID=79883 RepID=UPI003CEE825A